MITLAYSSYFLLCFGNVLYVSKEEEEVIMGTPEWSNDGSSVEPLDLRFIDQQELSTPLLYPNALD